MSIRYYLQNHFLFILLVKILILNFSKSIKFYLIYLMIFKKYLTKFKILDDTVIFSHESVVKSNVDFHI